MPSYEIRFRKMKTMKKKKVAIINQRYGLEVNGGSEYYTRLLAEHLNDIYDVEVLTTCALDYSTWDNYYPEGTEIINNVRVRRFRVGKTRKQSGFIWVDRLRRILPFPVSIIEKKWVEAQGPYCPNFLAYLTANQGKYDVFIFVTYLYYLTAMGMPQVFEKSILIPTAHDEPYIYFNIYKEIFCNPRGIVYLTDEERDFVQKLFHNEHITSTVAAIGVEIADEEYNPEVFRKKYNIENDYVIYVGRVDVGKGCDRLFEYFTRYKKETQYTNVKLVVMGKNNMELPGDCDIMFLGFVEDEDKYCGMKGARALILPSEFESLSISVLESMKLSVPVIVNGKCNVLKGHINKSNGGIAYHDYESFREAMDFMLQNGHDYNIMCENAKRYVMENYSWDAVITKVTGLIEKVPPNGG